MAWTDPDASADESGLGTIFMLHRPALLHFLVARGGEDAEDLLQELWVKAVGSKSGPIADPLSYLFRMANNLVLDRLRSARRRMRRENDWSDLSNSAGDVARPPEAERILLAREHLHQVEDVLQQLGERTASIFLRFRSDGINQREIAEEQGISLSAVEKHLQKAYRALMLLRADAENEERHRPVIKGADDVAR